MLTLTDQKTIAKAISNLSDVTSVANFVRDINAGTSRFLAKLSRPVDRQSKFTNIVSGQQYYQIPEDAERISKIKVPAGSTSNIIRSMIEIGDEEAWINMNQVPQSGVPTHFFVKGFDEFGLYPTPGFSVTDGIELIYEPKHVLLTADDYTTGTVSVSNGSATVAGNGTVFTNLMANGSYVLQITDGTDGIYYKITAYTNATTLTIENFYQGITNATATYRIGQVSKIPEEYQEAPVDYAMYRHFLEKNEMTAAIQFKTIWETSLKDAEDVYGMSTSNQIIMANGRVKTFNPLTDLTSNQINT
jgi:hypothetical protein